MTSSSYYLSLGLCTYFSCFTYIKWQNTFTSI